MIERLGEMKIRHSVRGQTVEWKTHQFEILQRTICLGPEIDSVLPVAAGVGSRHDCCQ